jgi:PAS domain-containing protein
MATAHSYFGDDRTTSRPQVRVHPTGGGQDSSAKSLDMATAQLLALRTIVDDLNYGIVVLDQERRVKFINRAFRRFWRVPDELADSQQAFLKLMYHGRGITAYAVSAHKLGEYVAKQLDLIRTGEERRLSNGEVIQFRCKALPDGGS